MWRSAIVLTLVIGIAPSVLAGPLHDAAGKGDLATVETLLAEGAKLDERGTNGETPLILAVLAGNDAVAELLIEKGAAIGGRNAGGFTPLHAAAYAGDHGIAELLIERGADANDAQNKSGVTPLFPAIEENQKEVAELLITQGADLSSKERAGYTALTRALFKGNEDMVILLRAHGAECQSDVLSESLNQACLAAGK
jgi:uncharacterized protein